MFLREGGAFHPVAQVLNAPPSNGSEPIRQRDSDFSPWLGTTTSSSNCRHAWI